jgi:hypothetical protein
LTRQGLAQFDLLLTYPAPHPRTCSFRRLLNAAPLS